MRQAIPPSFFPGYSSFVSEMRKMVGILLTALGGYLLICLAMYLGQEVFLFPTDTLPADYRFAIAGPYEEVWLDQPDGRIHGLYLSTPQARGAVLYFHGNGGNLAEWAGVAAPFHQRGLDVFIIDYRGYGKSQGPRSQAAMLADALSAYDWLAQRWPAEDIRLYGRSLGSGFAAYVAAQRPARALLLETPYYALADVAAGRFPWLPVRPLLRFPMPAYQWLEAVSCPIHWIHGDRDQVIPVGHSRRLQTLLPAGTYTEVPGGHHNDLEAFRAFGTWLDRGLDQAPGMR